MKPQVNNGTYPFCSNCPSDGNCCNRVKHEGEVDAPVLFPWETERIKDCTGKEINEFSKGGSGSEDEIRLMREGDQGCFFYREGKCAIYNSRPIDCRLFPLDFFKEDDGRILLIAYTNLCPVDFSPNWYIEHAEKLIGQLGEGVFKFAEVETPGMDKEPYVELGEIKNNQIIRFENASNLKSPVPKKP